MKLFTLKRNVAVVDAFGAVDDYTRADVEAGLVVVVI